MLLCILESQDSRCSQCYVVFRSLRVRDRSLGSLIFLFLFLRLNSCVTTRRGEEAGEVRVNARKEDGKEEEEEEEEQEEETGKRDDKTDKRRTRETKRH